MSRRLAPKLADARSRDDFLATVHYEAERAGLDPQLVLGVIQHESNFRKYAISSADARGYMQVMPFWTKLIGTPEHNLFHLRTNLRYGCVILRHYLDTENGDVYPRARPLQRQSRPARIPHCRAGGDEPELDVHAGRRREDRRPAVAHRGAVSTRSDSPRPRYRGRFAPSPTGPLHFGSLVAAIASYCDARAAGGQWLLRIEDVDLPRSRPGAEAAILATLERYGFAWDGEVARQSERTDELCRGARPAARQRRRLRMRVLAARARDGGDRTGRRARLSGNLPQRNSGGPARPSGSAPGACASAARASDSTTACRGRRHRTSRATSATSWCGARTGSSPTSSRSSSTTRSRKSRTWCAAPTCSRPRRARSSCSGCSALAARPICMCRSRSTPPARSCPSRPAPRRCRTTRCPRSSRRGASSGSASPDRSASAGLARLISGRGPSPRGIRRGCRRRPCFRRRRRSRATARETV